MLAWWSGAWATVMAALNLARWMDSDRHTSRAIIATHLRHWSHWTIAITWPITLDSISRPNIRIRDVQLLLMPQQQIASTKTPGTLITLKRLLLRVRKLMAIQMLSSRKSALAGQAHVRTRSWWFAAIAWRWLWRSWMRNSLNTWRVLVIAGHRYRLRRVVMFISLALGARAVEHTVGFIQIWEWSGRTWVRCIASGRHCHGCHRRDRCEGMRWTWLLWCGVWTPIPRVLHLTWRDGGCGCESWTHHFCRLWRLFKALSIILCCHRR